VVRARSDSRTSRAYPSLAIRNPNLRNHDEGIPRWLVQVVVSIAHERSQKADGPPCRVVGQLAQPCEVADGERREQGTVTIPRQRRPSTA